MPQPDPSNPADPALSETDRLLRGLRLLIVADSSTTHTHRWAHWFRDRGSEVTVLSPFADPIDGVQVIQFPARPRWYHAVPKLRMLLDYLPFRRMLRRLAPQLIHFHFVSEGGRGWYWNGLNIPIVCSTWGQDVIFDHGPRPRDVASLRGMLARSASVTATTRQLARATAPYVAPTTPIHVIPFGVDLQRFTPGAGSAGQIVTLGFVKHLLPKYGPDILVDAFAKIHRLRPHTRLVLAGRGPMRDTLIHRVAELGLEQAVDIPGRIPHEQVPELIRSFDIMAMPSVYESETFGVAAIEASACGVPVVASRVGGVPEAVLHEKTGLLVPPRDVDALVEACIRLIDDPAQRLRMGLTGRRFVEKYYSWPDNAKLMEEIYRSALMGDLPRSVPVYESGIEPILEVDAETTAPGTPESDAPGMATQANYHATHPAGHV